MIDGMRRTLKIIILALTLLCGTGCTTGYWTDRGRDAMDVFTATAGFGLGGRAVVGPVDIGLYGGVDMAGLRGGEWHNSFFAQDEGESGWNTLTMTCGLIGSETFEPKTSKFVVERRKHLDHETIYFIRFPSSLLKDKHRNISTYTQVEASLGIVLSLRFGFNPGELVDLFLGFVGVDIYDDDLEQRMIRKYGDEPVDPGN